MISTTDHAADHGSMRVLGGGRAREMLVFGRTMPADCAYEIGLAGSLAPPGKALEAALAPAGR